MTTSGGSTYTFSIKYADNTAINVSTIGDNDVRVTGPGGFDVVATKISVDVATNGTPRIATYTIPAAGGIWDVGDNGTYKLSMEAATVFDTEGDAVVAGQVGSFSVSIPGTFIVINTNDSGPGSLRDALDKSNKTSGADLITFDTALFSTPQTINLTTGQIPIYDSVTISGPGAKNVTISGAATASAINRIFYIDTPGTVTISGVTLTGGNVTGSGGAILQATSHLILNDSVLSGNKASLNGGAIYMYASSAKLTINTSTLSGNLASGSGNYDGGGAVGIYGASVVTINNSTLSGNIASRGGAILFYLGGSLILNGSTVSGNTASKVDANNSVGGGIYFYGTAGVFNILNSTISGNKAPNGPGGGIGLRAFNGAPLIRSSTITLNSSTKGGGFSRIGGSGAVTFGSSIVAQNTATDGPDVFVTDVAINADVSLIGDQTGLTIFGSGNLSGDAKLGALSFNGGPTMTHPPLAGSPLIDSGGNPGGFSVDQRGFPRLSNGKFDIGAIEVLPGVVVSSTPQPPNPTNGNSATFTLTFNQPVNFLTAANLTLSKTGSANGALGTLTPSADKVTWSVAVTGVVGDGNLTLNLANSTGLSVGLFPGLPFTGGTPLVVDHTAPTLQTITLLDPNPNNQNLVQFLATFSEPVLNVLTTNFGIDAVGVTGAVIDSIAGGGAVYTITVDTGTGDGTIGLNGVAAGTVTDLATNALIGFLVTGDVYTIDKTQPTLTITPVGPTLTNAQSVQWQVEFDEPVTGVADSNFDFFVDSGSISGMSITSVIGSGTSWTITADTGLGDGVIYLDLVDPTGITDAAGNSPDFTLSNTPFTIDRTAPNVDSIVRASPNPTDGASTVDFTVTFDEDVVGLSPANFTLTPGGFAVGTVSLSNSDFRQ